MTIQHPDPGDTPGAELTDRDRDTIERAEELAALTGADAVRKWAGATGYDIGSTLNSYVEAFGAAQALIFDLTDIIRRLDGQDAGDETYTCATCGATIGHFIGHGDGWHHYRGSGTVDDPNELYDPGHEATLGGMLP